MINVFVVALCVAAAACGAVRPRFPDEVQAAFAHDDMRRLETDRFIIYYPAHRRDEVGRFLVRADACAAVLREAAQIHSGAWNDKMVIAMPETGFNNAFVAPEALGYEPVSVIPTFATFDFTSEFGLLPDPGVIACHELVHYVHLEQIAGFWGVLNAAFGHLYTPQLGSDPWFIEGLATHYEAKLSPGVGRPRWPIFTGMFAAAFAGEHVRGGDLSAYARRVPGQHYLVGTMFLRFLTERHGERPLWGAIADQARAITGWFFAGTFRDGLHVSLGHLLEEFDAWCARSFPVRRRPAGQRTIATLGNGARYARGRDGTEAWVASDVDAPPRLVVRDPGGATLAELRLLDLAPPRTLVAADPRLVSGLSVTADGREVWLTIIDRATTRSVPRLLRWRRGETAVTEISHTLGPGATIDPAGQIYYYCEVDGDRWSLAAWDVRRGTRRVLVDAAPGTYVLGAQVSADGARLIANVWDGGSFVAWVLDAATGARLGELRGPGTPIWDASFTDDGRVMYLGVVDARFQLMIDGRQVTDAPYAMLAARSARGTIRFLDREGWRWALDEIAEPPVDAGPTAVSGPTAALGPTTAASGPMAVSGPATAPGPTAGGAPGAAPAVQSDEPYSAWDHFFVPQIRSPILVAFSTGEAHYGALLGGGDRLGLQRWSLSGYVQPREATTGERHWGGDVGYLNTMLAPWQILATAGFVDWVDPVEVDDGDLTLGELRRTRDASLSLGRTWRDTLTTTLSGLYTEDVVRSPGALAIERRLGGPSLSLAWASGETTAYTGLRRTLSAATSAAYYPHALSSFTGDIYDARGSSTVVLPLPFGARHTLGVAVRGRALLARDDTDLLQVGGFTDLAGLASGRSTTADPPAFDDVRFPPNQRFAEFLRGYEDHAITTDRVAIGSVWWRYPVIIDAGVAATFGFLPATFVRQLDLELFAAGAVDHRGETHAAAGGALILRLELLRVPLQVHYQVARRVRDDDALTQLLGLALGL